MLAGDSVWSAARSRGRVVVTASAEPPAGRAVHDIASRQFADQALFRRVCAHDEAALEALYDRFGGLVFTLALRIVGDRELAQEVVQDAFLRCWRGAERYNEARGSVAAWLMGVTRQPGHRPLAESAAPGALARADRAPSRPRRGRPRPPSDAPRPSCCAIWSLTPWRPCRRGGAGQAIALAYYGGLTQTEIARVTNVPLGTVKSRIRDGVEQLRHDLRPQIEADLRPRDGHE